jgi:Mg-chelatase subunit ChlD
MQTPSNLTLHYFDVKDEQNISCIHVKATDIMKRTPVHFIVVLDTSGSMDMEGKLKHVAQSIHFMLDFFTDNDLLSIITFSENATIHVRQEYTTSDRKSYIRQLVSGLTAETYTNMSDALVSAEECIIPSTDARSEQYKQGILLLTDGIANRGMIQTESLNQLVNRLIQENHRGAITLSTVGYGSDHNDELMRQMAITCGGSYNIVHTIEDVASVFGDILGGLASCIIQKLEVEVPITVDALTQYVVRNEGDKRYIMIGDVSSACERTLLLAGVVPDSIVIRGYDLQKFTHFSTSLVKHHDAEASAELQTIAYSTLMRWQTVEIMTTLKEICLKNFERRANDMRTSVEEQIRKVKAVQEVYPHPVLPLLLDELEECNHIINHAYPVLGEAIQYLNQHGTYYGQGRGILSPRRPDYERHYGDRMDNTRGAPMTPPPSGHNRRHNMSSPTIYANTLQQNMSATIRNAALAATTNPREFGSMESNHLTYSNTTASSVAYTPPASPLPRRTQRPANLQRPRPLQPRRIVDVSSFAYMYTGTTEEQVENENPRE